MISCAAAIWWSSRVFIWWKNIQNETMDYIELVFTEDDLGGE